MPQSRRSLLSVVRRPALAARSLLARAPWLGLVLMFTPTALSAQVALRDWPVDEPIPVQSLSTRIRGGMPTSDRRIVGIFFYDDRSAPKRCSGLYVDTLRVLTAKHCTCHQNTFLVTNSNSMLNSDRPHWGVARRLQQFGRPCDRLSDFALNEGNDLALLQLSGPLPDGYSGNTCSSYSLRGDLASGADWFRSKNTSATVYGFGDNPLDRSPNSAQRKRTANLLLTSFACANMVDASLGCAPYREFILRGSSPVVRADTCPGDSGGPVFVIIGGRAQLVGVTSHGVEGGGADVCGSGGVYEHIGRMDTLQWLTSALLPPGRC